MHQKKIKSDFFVCFLRCGLFLPPRAWIEVETIGLLVEVCS